MFTIVPNYIQAAALERGLDPALIFNNDQHLSILNEQDVIFYSGLQLALCAEMFPDTAFTDVQNSFLNYGSPFPELKEQEASMERMARINQGLPVDLFSDTYIGTSSPYMEVKKIVNPRSAGLVDKELPFYVVLLKESESEDTVPFNEESLKSFRETVLLENLGLVQDFSLLYSQITIYNL